MRIVLSILALCVLQTVQADPSQVSSPRLAALEQSLERDEPAALEKFWKEIATQRTPLMEPVAGAQGRMWVTFIWRAKPGQGAVNMGVSEVGEHPRADAAGRRFMQLANSDLWYRTFQMSDQARFSYSLTCPLGREPHPQSVKVEEEGGVAYEFFLDPLNPVSLPMRWVEKTDATTWVDWERRVSHAQGPKAPLDAYVTRRPAANKGKVVTMQFASKALGNIRKIDIYTPPGKARGCVECGLLVLFDRAPFTTAVPTPDILDNMIADGAIPPLVAVLVGNAEAPARGRELPPNPEFQQFLRNELLPWLRERLDFSNDPRQAVVAGASYGGLAASYAGLRNPDVFGNVLSMSGSYWWWPEYVDDPDSDNVLNDNAGWVARQYAATPKLPLKLYLDVGAWEGSLMLLPNRAFRDVLQARGYDITYREFAGGHDFGAWRSTFSEGLKTLIGYPRQ